jgi:hypothetical protein
MSETVDNNDKPVNHITHGVDKFEYDLKRFIQLPPENDTIQHFDTLVSKFINFLFKAHSKILNPVHPAVTYYRKREKN